MNTIVRKATLNDLPTLLQFEQDLIKVERPMNPTIKEGAINYYDIAAFIKNEDADVYVVTLEDATIVASGYARILPKEKPYVAHETIGYLGFMFVPEAHRGNGYNQLIMDALLNWCKQRNIHEIRLDVYDVNTSAIKAYEKVGFKKHLINMRLNLNDLLP